MGAELDHCFTQSRSTRLGYTRSARTSLQASHTKHSRLEVRRMGSANESILVDLWNRLPSHVIQATTVSTFKNRFDTFKKETPQRFRKAFKETVIVQVVRISAVVFG